MIKLSYTQYARQFICKIENIKELSILSLQKLEDFAAQRSGKLDYDKESIIIPKRIELQYLQELFKLKDIEVFITEKEAKKTAVSQTATINYGKFKGQKWTELSDDYLQWVSQNINSEDRQIAIAELERRKTKAVPQKRKEIISFGKHRGELWEELPTAYLQWVSQNLKGESQNIAMDVLQRRK